MMRIGQETSSLNEVGLEMVSSLLLHFFFIFSWTDYEVDTRPEPCISGIAHKMEHARRNNQNVRRRNYYYYYYFWVTIFKFVFYPPYGFPMQTTKRHIVLGRAYR